MYGYGRRWPDVWVAGRAQGVSIRVEPCTVYFMQDAQAANSALCFDLTVPFSCVLWVRRSERPLAQTVAEPGEGEQRACAFQKMTVLLLVFSTRRW
jgi:hypothetical protein